MAACEPCDTTPPAFFFSKGKGTYVVKSALPVAARAKLVAALTTTGASGVVLLRGGLAEERNDTDHEVLFRQESYFQYLFGVSEAGCFGAVSLPRSAHALSTLCLDPL